LFMNSGKSRPCVTEEGRGWRAAVGKKEKRGKSAKREKKKKTKVLSLVRTRKARYLPERAKKVAPQGSKKRGGMALLARTKGGKGSHPPLRTVKQGVPEKKRKKRGVTSQGEKWGKRPLLSLIPFVGGKVS